MNEQLIAINDACNLVAGLDMPYEIKVRIQHRLTCLFLSIQA